MKCVIYGQCDGNACLNSTSPKELSNESQLKLQQVCKPYPISCCDSVQVDVLEQQLKILKRLAETCPACAENLAKLWCEMTCSPEQSSFLKVLHVEGVKVKELEYRISKEFADGLFASCKDVKLSSNGKLMDLIGGNAKSGYELMNYMGSISETKVFFPKGYESFNPKIEPCNSTKYKCKCFDCFDSCPLVPMNDEFKFPQLECSVFSFNCMSLFFSILFTFLLISIISLGFMAKFKKQEEEEEALIDPNDVPLPRSQESMHHSKQPSIGGIYISPISISDDFSDEYASETSLETEESEPVDLFFLLAIFGSKYRKKKLIWGSVLCFLLILSAFTTEGQFLTSPIDLWVSSKSKTYQSRVFFDENFGPFYRIHQVITKDLSFLFDFEQKLKELGHDDLCFKPNFECVIYSVTCFWQNNKTIYLNDANWKQTLEFCLNYPQQCLSESNVMMNREMVTDKSNTVFFTTLLDKKMDLEFEQKISEYLLNSKVDLSFMLESSLETEIKKTTVADFKTILLSYLAMFLYIFYYLKSFWFSFLIVFIVGLSTILSICLMIIFKFPVSFLVFEVVPFLVLAVGVDNFFILIDSHHNAVSQVLIGCTLSFICELFVFFITIFVDIPVVTSFAQCSCFALMFLFLFQFFVFPCFLEFSPKITKDIQSWNVYLSLISKHKKNFKRFSLFLLLMSVLFIFQLPELGLDQRDAIPKDSHLQKHFDNQLKYFEAGPSVYFMKQTKITKENAKEFCSKFNGCLDSSIPNTLTEISTPTTWFDDFLQWLNPETLCCVEQEPCLKNWSMNLDEILNQVHDLDQKIQLWRSMMPSEKCPTAGGVSQDQVNVNSTAFAYRVLTKPLKTQKDYIDSFLKSKELAHRTKTTVYSVFHVFFEQYDSIVLKLFILVVLSVSFCFLMSYFFFNIMFAVSMLKAMVVYLFLLTTLVFGVFSTPLNALSLCNFVMGIGLGIEFCIHVLKNLNKPQQVSTMGAVFSGISITKLVGTTVLSFARSKLFLTLYFFVYLSVCISGTLVSMVFIPI